MSTVMNTAQEKSYAKFIVCAHSPRLTEAATTTLSVGKHLIKIPTAGCLVDSCGALLHVMVCGRLKTDSAHFVLGRTALILGNFLCTIHYNSF